MLVIFAEDARFFSEWLPRRLVLKNLPCVATKCTWVHATTVCQACGKSDEASDFILQINCPFSLKSFLETSRGFSTINCMKLKSEIKGISNI